MPNILPWQSPPSSEFTHQQSAVVVKVTDVKLTVVVLAVSVKEVREVLEVIVVLVSVVEVVCVFEVIDIVVVPVTVLVFESVVL